KYAVESNSSWAARSVEEYRVLVGDSVQLEQAKGGSELEQTFTKVVLHIGFPKTGTSSLQRWLENNRTNLLDQGVWYPASFVGRGSGYREGRTSGHSPLIYLLSSPLTRRFAVRRIAQEAAALRRPAHTLLLSSEMILSHHFWTSHKRKRRSHIMTRLRKALKVENTEVLLVTRPPLEWVERYFKEVVSNHTLRRSPDFFSFAKRLKRLGLVDVAGILSFLEETFPRGSVGAASYSQVLQKGELVEFVAETLDLDMSSLTDPGHIRDNVSLSDGQVDAIRQMARLRMSRRQRDRIYLEILESDELKQARFELNRPAEIDKVSRLLEKEVIAFDKLFPGASEGTREEAGESGDVYFPRLGGFKHRLLLFPNAWVQPRLVSKILKPVLRIAFSKLRPIKVGTQRLALRAHQHFYVEKVLPRRIVSGSWDFGGRRGAALRRLGKSSATE
ncbi:MAG: hypothetical protein HOK04_01765, partial [Verrucomicrobia bacterium]|nr:hypothetical protein [Verrucomicrobiota bacterium]